MNNQLNIEIGKPYPANFVLQEMLKNTKNDVRLGHIMIIYEKEKKHKYYVDKKELSNLKDLQIKVLTIMSKPNLHNFTCKILENKEVKDILEIVKNDNSKCCILDENDLKTANISNKRKAIISINSVFKSNNMSFKASSHEKGIQIKYKETKNLVEIKEELK